MGKDHEKLQKEAFVQYRKERTQECRTGFHGMCPSENRNIFNPYMCTVRYV